jgi:meso-butanediol dehydrogenase/(S,S)-butanediol dehydrogenase/diacetyl reductase
VNLKLPIQIVIKKGVIKMFRPEFEGKVGILIGCSRTSGMHIARRFMQEGMITVVGSRSKEVLKIYEDLKKEFPDAEGYAQVVDASKEEQIKDLIQGAAKKYGRIDVVSYHSAYHAPLIAIEDLTEDILDVSYGVNLKGPAFTIKYCAPIMKAQRSGSIVITSSWYARKGVPYFSPYCTTKGAEHILVQCAALELAEYGVRVNAFAPGDIENEAHYDALRQEASIRGITYEEMTKITINNIPMRKRLDPERMGGIILFLSSKEADHITAENINVSGGSEFR